MNKYTKYNLKGNGFDNGLFLKNIPSYYQKGYGIGSFFKNTFYNYIKEVLYDLIMFAHLFHFNEK